MISTYQLKKILKDTSLGPTWSRETAETLKKAVKDCDEEILIAILSLDVDINFEFRGGDTLLSLVIRYANTTNWAKTARLLIDKGANFNIIDSRGIPILCSIVSNGEHDLMQYVLNQGADIEIRGHSGETPLITAIHFRQLKCLETLLKMGANPNAATPDGNTALIWVASRPTGGTCQSKNMLKLLLEHGAHINQANKRGLTALMTAAIIEEADVVQFLLDVGADYKIKDRKGENALIKAVSSSCEQVVNVLLKLDLNINETDKYGLTALMNAHRADILEKLLIAGANPNARTHKGNTSLHFQVKKNDLYVIERLIEYGADLGALNNAGETPLHLAIRGRSIDVTYMLINAGSEISLCNLKGISLVHETLFSWDYYSTLNLFEEIKSLDLLQEVQNYYQRYRDWSLTMIKLLISNGVPTDLPTEEGIYPLMLATLSADIDMVEVLLNNGADLFVKDFKGRNLMAYAAKSGNLALVKKLAYLGCETTLEDNDGCYPIYYAAYLEHDDIVKFLMLDYAFTYCANLR